MNILIVEDEIHTASLLKEFVEKNEGYQVLNICDSITSTVQYLKNFASNVNLIFMDVQLADGESFEIFSKTDIKVPVIFCTAFDDYILQAFKNNGIDYILKPFKESDIEHALSKVEGLRDSLSEGSQKSSTSLPFPKTGQQTFLVRKLEKMIPIDSSKIALFHLYNEQLNLYSLVGEKFTMFKTMEELESSISKSDFYRINRQMIVNRNAVKDIEPYFNRKVIVNFSFPIPKKAIVSRLKVTPFLDWLERPEG